MKLKAKKNFNHSGIIGVLGEHLKEDPGKHLDFLVNEGFVMIDDPEVQAEDEPAFYGEEGNAESVLPNDEADTSEDEKEKHPKKKKNK